MPADHSRGERLRMSEAVLTSAARGGLLRSLLARVSPCAFAASRFRRAAGPGFSVGWRPAPLSISIEWQPRVRPDKSARGARARDRLA